MEDANDNVASYILESSGRGFGCTGIPVIPVVCLSTCWNRGRDRRNIVMCSQSELWYGRRGVPNFIFTFSQFVKVHSNGSHSSTSIAYFILCSEIIMGKISLCKHPSNTFCLSKAVHLGNTGFAGLARSLSTFFTRCTEEEGVSFAKVDA